MLTNDGNTNDCLSAIASRAFRRTYQSTGTPLCTRRNEDGCRTSDNGAFWARSGMSERFTWDWRAQDYPHDDAQGHYDPSSTTEVYARVWLHREMEPEVTRASSFSDPQTLAVSTSGPSWVVRGPIYDLKIYHWWLATPSDPWGPLSILTPIPREVDELPQGWAWLTDVDNAATSALAVTAFGPSGATAELSRPSAFYGAHEFAFNTAGFGAARFEEATFAFGGQTRSGELSAGFWLGFPYGDTYAWLPIESAMTPMAQGGAATPAVTASATSSSPIPKGKSYADWLARTKAKLGVSRPSLSQLAAAKKSAFVAAMAKRAAAKKQAASNQAAKPAQSSQSSMPLPASPAFPRATMSFGSGSPEPQKHAAVLGHREAMLVAILFGSLAEPRGEGDPVPVAVWDLNTSEWIVGEVDWSCGPRHDVGYTATRADARAIIFYGGKLGDDTVDGLYRKSLDPEDLFDGSDVTRLDEASEGGPPRPGPRANAALAYEPQNGLVYLFGGSDENGVKQNDLWVFSEKTKLWTQLSTGQEPIAPAATLAAGIAISPYDGSPVIIAGGPTEGNDAAFWRWTNNTWRIERALGE